MPGEEYPSLGSVEMVMLKKFHYNYEENSGIFLIGINHKDEVDHEQTKD